ncbi:unnamed protein product [Brachionus calyciflorus]|uniref:C-type lectin domain-containing protein n=1 Tax=Brachionus calyciflorus TaxID=104777 RepID=A0A814CNB1_9BILA|nr:unnamed protein product [Brachionus calyciflorus]
MKILNIFLITIYMSIKTFICLEIKSTYKRLNYDLNDYSWLISSIKLENMDIYTCLKKCQTNYYCAYVQLNSTNCNMFNEYAIKSLLPSSKTIIYKKIERILHMDNCIKENVFLSLNNNSCVECPYNFIKYSKFPYACYSKSNDNMKFATAKLYCISQGGFLLRPKSEIERNLLTEVYELFQTNRVWVDSAIEKTNEEYKWNDGTKVGGFKTGKPSNDKGLLCEKILALNEGYFSDVSERETMKFVCQFN